MGKATILTGENEFSISPTNSSIYELEFPVRARAEHHRVSFEGKVVTVSLQSVDDPSLMAVTPQARILIDFRKEFFGYAFKKLKELQGITPVIAHFDQEGSYSGSSSPLFIFRNRLFKYARTQAVLNPDAVRLELLDALEGEQVHFERLKAKFESRDAEESNLRQAIPEAVRIIVWRRDGGKCVRCGSRKNLEYDHIIPVSKGGSNSERNLELLCQVCNREKSSKIQ